MKDYIEERAIGIANYIIDHNATVRRQTAKTFGISKSTKCAVIGIEDSTNGKVPKAFLVMKHECKRDKGIVENEVKELCITKLAERAVPYYFEFIDELPANAATAIPELTQIAKNPSYQENRKEKHDKDAKQGWYRYDVRFAIPVYENDVLVRYNVFGARLLINHAETGKKYLYDILTIKKKRASHNNKCGENPFLI